MEPFDSQSNILSEWMDPFILHLPNSLLVDLCFMVNKKLFFHASCFCFFHLSGKFDIGVGITILFCGLQVSETVTV